jgi:rhodanese-related sulfurtransferase
MNIWRKGVAFALYLPLVGGLLPLSAYANSDSNCFYESRRGVAAECGIYKGEVSAAKAYMDGVVHHGLFQTKKRSEWPVILDVRSLPEYKAGHPGRSYNVPYPYIYQYCDAQGREPDGACKKALVDDDGKRVEIKQEVSDFVSYVESIVPDKNTPIYTLCRTGSRSVGAANRLTEAGYKNVYNIWEGFVGINLKAPQYGVDENGNQVVVDAAVDLNHDGKFTDQDKNGWIYFGGLPYSTRLLPNRIYKPYAAFYRYD